jgi:hypothetical protein
MDNYVTVKAMRFGGRGTSCSFTCSYDPPCRFDVTYPNYSIVNHLSCLTKLYKFISDLRIHPKEMHNFWKLCIEGYGEEGHGNPTDSTTITRATHSGCLEKIINAKNLPALVCMTQNSRSLKYLAATTFIEIITLPMLSYLLSNKHLNYLDINNIIYGIVQNDRNDLLRYMHTHGRIYRTEVCNIVKLSIRHRSHKCLKYFIKNGFKCDWNTLKLATKTGHLEKLVKMHGSLKHNYAKLLCKTSPKTTKMLLEVNVKAPHKTAVDRMSAILCDKFDVWHGVIDDISAYEMG